MLKKEKINVIIIGRRNKNMLGHINLKIKLPFSSEAGEWIPFLFL